MGLTASATPRLDQAQALPQRQASDTDDRSVGWIEGIGAGFRSGMDQNGWHKSERLADGYNQIVDAVAKANGKTRDDYRWTSWQDSGFGQQGWDRNKVWRDIDAARQRDPNFLPGLKERDWQQFESNILTRKGRAQADAATAGRAGFAPALIGQAGAAFTDPVNVIGGGALGGLASGVARSVVAEGLARVAVETLAQGAANAAVEGVQLYGDLTAKGREGPTPSAGDIAMDLGSAALMGGAMHLGTTAIGAAGHALYGRLPEGFRMLRETEALQLPQVSDAEVLARFDAHVPQADRTPDEVDAAHVLRRDIEVKASNPYEATYAGQALHEQRLNGAIEQLTTGTPPKAIKARGLDPEIVSFFRGKGFSEAQARGIAAGVAAESGGSHGAVNPKSGAYGLGQWLGARRAALIERYGENPTKAQQLEFLHHELTGGDHGGRHVLAQSEESAVLDAYIRKFMRPKAGAETDGDLTRGMAALGRGEEMAVRAEGIGDMADADAAMADARMMAAEANAMDMAGMAARGDGAAETVPGLEPHPSETMPRLQLDLFSDETTARVAQAQADADALGMETPVYTRQHAWEEARDQLMRDQAGEVPGALFHPEVGPIDVVWGNEKGGLAHIAQKHPEVLQDLPQILEGMDIVPERTSSNRIHLESPDHIAKVRLDYDGQAKRWLLTAYKKDRKAPTVTEDGGVTVKARDHSPSAGAEADIAPGARGDNMAQAQAQAATEELATTSDYTDPVGPKLTEQSDRLTHDMRIWAEEDTRAYRMEDGREVSIKAINEEADAEEAALKALRGCL